MDCKAFELMRWYDWASIALFYFLGLWKTIDLIHALGRWTDRKFREQDYKRMKLLKDWLERLDSEKPTR